MALEASLPFLEDRLLHSMLQVVTLLVAQEGALGWCERGA